jgi:hypothetical protein
MVVSLKMMSMMVQVEPALEKQLATCIGWFARREVALGAAGSAAPAPAPTPASAPAPGGAAGCGDGCRADTTGPFWPVARCLLQTSDLSVGITGSMNLDERVHDRVQGPVYIFKFMLTCYFNIYIHFLFYFFLI